MDEHASIDRECNGETLHELMEDHVDFVRLGVAELISVGLGVAIESAH